MVRLALEGTTLALLDPKNWSRDCSPQGSGKARVCEAFLMLVREEWNGVYKGLRNGEVSADGWGHTFSSSNASPVLKRVQNDGDILAPGPGATYGLTKSKCISLGLPEVSPTTFPENVWLPLPPNRVLWWLTCFSIITRGWD